jgi:4-carboxymuconolactone decarboxylase
VTHPSAEVTAILESGWQHDGHPLNMPATLAVHPLLLKRFTLFAGTFLTQSLLPPRDRELLTLRAAYVFDVEYYFGHHKLLAARAGLTEADVVATTEPAHAWQGDEALVIELVNQLAARTMVDDDLWDRLSRRYDDAELLEAVNTVMLVGFYRMVAGLVNSAGVQREVGVPGWPRRDEL